MNIYATLPTTYQKNHYYTATTKETGDKFNIYRFFSLKDAHNFLELHKHVASYDLHTISYGRQIPGWYTRRQVRGIESNTPDAIKPRKWWGHLTTQ